MGQDQPENILAVITARGGSKGVPRKNIRELNGKPLIAYTIEALKGAADALYKVIVSTDDEEIASVARQYGADVPFMRPSELATDTAASLPVVQHALREVEKQDDVRIDATMLVQPTNPFLTTEFVKKGLDVLHAHDDATGVVSVVENISNHPLKALKLVDGVLQSYIAEAPQATRRQDLEPVFKRNGSFYITRRNVLMNGNDLYGARLYPCIMPEISAIDIDTEVDMVIAETLFKLCNDNPECE